MCRPNPSRRAFLTATAAATALPWLGETLAAIPATAPEKGTPPLRPIGYRGVTITDEAVRTRLSHNVALYLDIPDDCWLKPFRQRAGRPAPGKDVGGNYSGNCWHIFGQVVSGLARYYAATRDSSVKAKVDALVAGWFQCLAPDGFFFPQGPQGSQPPHPHYVFEKTVCGLVDAKLYCDSPHAIDGLSRITDWAGKHLDRTNQFAFIALTGPSEWYTLSENLLRAYTLTGDQKYRDFAEVWNYGAFWDLFGTHTDPFAKRKDYHAYSHANTMDGAAEFYRVTGQPRYLADLVAFHDWLLGQQCYATGGWGPEEQMLPRTAVARSVCEKPTNHFETQCGCWAAFKLTKHLLSFTGDARFGHWCERLLYNGLLASLPPRADGSIFYFSSYGADGCAKEYSTYKWTCCNGTLIQAWADIHDQIYYRGTEGADLYINLFVASTLDTHIGGEVVRINLDTRFPFEDDIRLKIAARKPVDLSLNLRLPDWLGGPMTATLDGQPVQLVCDGRGWARLRRTWAATDVLTLKVPMQFRAVPLASLGGFSPTAINYGPLTMVVPKHGNGTNPSRLFDFTRLNASLAPVPGKPLNFALRSNPGVTLKPYLTCVENEPYFMYFKQPSVTI